MRDLFVMFRTPSVKKVRHRVLDWLMREFRDYADDKYPVPVNDDKWMREDGGFAADSEWVRQITQYWGRGMAMGLDTPQGQQAILKSITTLIDGAAAMISVYGNHLPIPGYPSGEIHMPREEVEADGEDPTVHAARRGSQPQGLRQQGL